MKNRWLILFSLIGLLGCGKDITVNLPSPDNKIVVEGYIEPGQPIKVFLSRNSPYFAPVDSTNLQKFNIHGAIVTVSDGTQTVQLTEIQVNGLSAYIYLDSSYPKAGKSYKLNVKIEDETVNALTFIPPPVRLDSVKFRKFGGSDTFGVLHCFFKDPDTLGNYYRFLSRRLNIDQTDFAINVPVTFSTVFNDKVVNGKSFEFDLERGTAPSERGGDQIGRRGLFEVGDTIILKWIAIDKSSYDFWSTYERNVGSSGNPFGTPVIVKSNVIGGLGVWSGYGSVLDTIIAK